MKSLVGSCPSMKDHGQSDGLFSARLSTIRPRSLSDVWLRSLLSSGVVVCMAGAELGCASGFESERGRTWAGAAILASCISAVPLYPPCRCDRLADPMELAVASTDWIAQW